MARCWLGSYNVHLKQAFLGFKFKFCVETFSVRWIFWLGPIIYSPYGFDALLMAWEQFNNDNKNVFAYF